jgi:TFIIF-interacting CTD phosphatase-like protein
MTEDTLPVHPHLVEKFGLNFDETDWLDETMIVLDLDETKTHTSTQLQKLIGTQILAKPEYAHLRSRIIMLDFYDENGNLSDDHMWSVKRPHLDTFIKWAFRRMNYVVVWSAGVRHYVDRLVKGIFTDAGHPEPHAVLAREDCYIYEGDIIKPLDLLYEKLPWIVGRVRRKNMLLLDDKESNFIMNYDRGLLIEAYTPKATVNDIEKDDRQLIDAIGCIDRRFGWSS